MRARLGEGAAALAAVFPDLAGVLGPAAPAAAGPEAFGEARTLAALAALAGALGSARRPALILLDDCQWADDLTAKLLARLAAESGEPGAAGRHTAVIAAFRAEEVPAGHALRRIRAAARVALAPLAWADLRLLLESMAGPLPDEAIDSVHRLSSGNPFLAGAALEGLVESGALAAGERGWTAVAGALADAPSSRRAGVVLARRVERLPPEVLGALGVAAVLGREFALEDVAALSGRGPGEARAVLDVARRRHLVRLDPGDGRGAFVHDRVREALLERLGEEDRRRLHLRAALRLEEGRPASAFERAHHFDRAGEPARALPHALAAAEEARARLAFEAAERNYAIAERGATASGAGADLRRRIAEGLGDVLRFRGRFPEATRRLEEARALATDALALAGIELRIGDVALDAADAGGATAAYERGLERLGRPAPRGALSEAAALARESAAYGARALLGASPAAGREGGASEADVLEATLCARLADACIFDVRMKRALWAHLRALNLAERLGTSRERVLACAMHVALLLETGRPERAEAYASRAEAAARASGDAWLEAYAEIWRGAVRDRGVSGDPAGARADFARAGAVMRRLGDLRNAHIAAIFDSYAARRTGRLSESAALARRVHAEGAEVGSPGATAFALFAWAYGAPGDVPWELIREEVARPNPMPLARRLVAGVEGARLLADGRVDEAVERLERCAADLRGAGGMEPFARNLLARALRAAAERVPPYDGAGRRRAAERADRAAESAVRLARGGYPAYLAEALSEAGRAAALAGEPARARRLLDESIALAERRGARCDAAQALLARGEVGRALGWPGAAEEEARAREALRALDPPPHPSPAPAPAAEGAAPPPTLSLIDRFSTVLEAGRRIASQLSREPIFTATLDAARALLRAEACAIVEVGREPSSGAAPAGAAAEAAVPARRAAGATPVAASGGAGAGASAALLARALAAGRPVVAREGAGPEGDGLLAAGVRSALCAPIHVRGAPVACLCATHRSVAGLFGATEERLAEFVAAIAGAALENAEGFARVEALGRSLEASVADLTDANAEVRRLGAALARGQEEERRRVALAIHDSAEQELIALAIEVERAAGRAVDAPAVAGLKSSIGRILEGLRRLSHDLRPGALDRLGLSAALADLARSLTSDALAVDFAAEGEGAADRDAVPGEAATAAYRIAQAALANVVRHARARRARVRLRVAPPSLRLEVEDDGAGFDPERLPPGRGLGLVGMRERAGWLGGSFAVESAPGRGARIALELPIPGRDPA